MGVAVRFTERVSGSWGDWALGDLADGLLSVSRLIGPSFPAVKVSVYPPNVLETLPTVQLVVPDRLRLEGVRSLVARAGDRLVPLDAGESETNFHAVTDDVLLCVWTKD
jgi:hypothetical protein